MATTIRTITIPQELSPVAVLGAGDEALRQLQRMFTQVSISMRGNVVSVQSASAAGELEAQQVERLMRMMIQAAYDVPLQASDIQRIADQEILKNDVRHEHVQRIMNGANHGKVIAVAQGRPIRAQTPGQNAYVNAIRSHTITFAIGPAGTGKTYLAVAQAVRMVSEGKVHKIILTRPAVEAGENLGYLPGSMHEKVDPYVRPLYDALADMLGVDQLRRFMDDGIIEVAPLAYMRGRTLHDAFVILDEAQNTTAEQMKMFLTRLGFNTTMVITGDVTQIDLAVRHSGLARIEQVLQGIDDIAFIHLHAKDVVRHELVGKIVQAYDRFRIKTTVGAGTSSQGSEGVEGSEGSEDLERSHSSQRSQSLQGVRSGDER